MSVKLNCESFFIRKCLSPLGICPQLVFGQSRPGKQCVEDLVCMCDFHLNQVSCHQIHLGHSCPGKQCAQCVENLVCMCGSHLNQVSCHQIHVGQSCPGKQCVEDLVCMGGCHLNLKQSFGYNCNWKFGYSNDTIMLDHEFYLGGYAGTHQCLFRERHFYVALRWAPCKSALGADTAAWNSNATWHTRFGLLKSILGRCPWNRVWQEIYFGSGTFMWHCAGRHANPRWVPTRRLEIQMPRGL